MDKQELIEKLKGHGAWCTECHDINGEKDRYVKVAKVRELLEQLDEPQKVKVPAFVAEWFEENKHNLNFAIYELCEAGKVPVDLYEGLTDFERWFYLNHDIDTLIRMQDGYEVEEEPKYCVKIGGLYLKEPLGDTNDFTINMTWNKDYAYLFDSWNMAREHASELGGAVEKVEE